MTAKLAELDRHNKSLVDEARTLLDKHPVYKDLGPTALRNLVDVAKVATCLEEIHAFVQYQVGRYYKEWSRSGFDKAMLAALGPNGFIAGLSKDVGERVELTLRWLGYMNRYFRYRHTLHDKEGKG